MRQADTRQNQCGTYILVLENRRKRSIAVGKLGECEFEPGFYLYVGSAFGPGGVPARVKRHFRKNKAVHWHVDHLTRFMLPRECWFSLSQERLECRWNDVLESMHDAYPAIGLGSTDCACRSHLHYFNSLPGRNEFGHRCGQHLETLRG